MTLTAVSVFDGDTCALTSQGGVQCWGENTAGQLGNNSSVASSVPVPVSGLASGVAAVSVALGAACALTTAGAVLCWGRGGNLIPSEVQGLSCGIGAIGVSGTDWCALSEAGQVLCLGDDEEGQLGDGSETATNVPVAVSGLTSGVAQIAAGLYFECALTAAGGVLCLGANEEGEIGNNSTARSGVPVAVSGLSSGVTAISAGFEFACAVTSGGSVGQASGTGARTKRSHQLT